MKRFAVSGFLCVLMLAVATPANFAVKNLMRYTHKISEHVITESSICSATAIAPHALLTATHCEEPTDEVRVDDADDSMWILGTLRDKNDHTILLVSGTFKDYADLSGRDPEIGDSAEIVGNPHGREQTYRRGYVSKVQRVDPIEVIFGGGPNVDYVLYDLNVFPGDSGAAVFDADGRISEVVSALIPLSDDGQFEGKFTAAFVLNFSKKQLKQAHDFVPPSEKQIESSDE